MTVPSDAGEYRAVEPTSSTVLAQRRIMSAYSGLMGRRLRSLGGSCRSAGIAAGLEEEDVVGAQFLEEVTTPARRPVSSDATVTTVVIPITMPRMVRKERKRCVQTADIAIACFRAARYSFYSARSATIGSSFAARDAGYQPLMTPTAPDTKTDSTT